MNELPGDASYPPGTSESAITKRFGEDKFLCPRCGEFLCLERITGDDGWTSNQLVCPECSYVCDQ